MNEQRQDYSRRLVASIKPSLPPVAIALCDSVPDGVPEFDGTVPAGCAFWEKATTQTFATAAGDHKLCSIGVHTHNLSGTAPSQPQELMASLEAMTGLDYLREEEIASIPAMERESRHAVYGPLKDFPVEPDVVLIFTHPGNGLVIAEAVARVDGGNPPAMGRPACAVIPQVLNQKEAAMSLGCCGARAYLDMMSDDIALWAFPAEKLEQYCEQLDVFSGANSALTSFHSRRRTDVESGERPTVLESLQRITP